MKYQVIMHMYMCVNCWGQVLSILGPYIGKCVDSSKHKAIKCLEFFLIYQFHYMLYI